MNPMIATLTSQKEAIVSKWNAVNDSAALENRAFSADEDSAYEADMATVDGLTKRITQLANRALADAEQATLIAKLNNLSDNTVVKVGSEPVTYRAHGDNSFFRDLVAAEETGDYSAKERLSRHTLEQRATTTSSYGSGLVVPQYLVEEFAAVVREARPFADAINNKPLPAKGQSLSIPKGTTGTSAASQATQNTAVSETDYVAGTVDFNVVTIAGAQEVSFQALDRGENVDSIIYSDLVAAYSGELDRQTLLTDGTSGTHEGIVYVDGKNTVSGASITNFATFNTVFWTAWSAIRTTRLASPDIMVMTSGLWGWLNNQLDTTGRPLLAAANPTNNPGSFTSSSFAGVTVIVDDNLDNNGAATPANHFFLAKSSDIYLFEESRLPKYVRLDQPKGKNLTSQLVTYGYSAFTGERYPTAIAYVNGVTVGF